MALRAFFENPLLGGFGGESSGLGIIGRIDANCKGGKKGRKEISASRKTHVTIVGEDDSFAQIVKELVDNAVDACFSASQQELRQGTETRRAKARTRSSDSKKIRRCSLSTTVRRVRVVLEPEMPPCLESASPGPSDDEESGDELLRVTVTDNGCGMENIQDCVTAFHTSKATVNQEQQTAGRYGMGLTLCLLHAQRLVGESCTVITSATSFQKTWTRAKYVVDAGDDAITCVFNEQTQKKNSPTESGTAVSLLLPGGIAARRAWPRLAEYFARFHLSLGNVCSVEVLAPTLSTTPLFIRPPIEVTNDVYEKKNQSTSGRILKSNAIPQCKDSITKHIIHAAGETYCFEDASWHDAFTTITPRKDDSQHPDSGAGRMTPSPKPFSKESTSEDESESDYSETDDDDASRTCYPIVDTTDATATKENTINENLRKAVRDYLCQPIDIRNVAHSLQPIRRVSLSGEQGINAKEKNSSYRQKEKRKMDASSTVDKVPMLEVNMIVFEAKVEEDIRNNNDGDRNGDNVARQEEDEPHSHDVAKLILIRLVNRVPILDGVEAHACGLVRGIASKHKTWNLFGLDVDVMPPQTFPHMDSKYEETTMLATNLHLPIFRVTDGSQLAPYLNRNGAEKNRHHQYEGWEVNSEDDSYVTYSPRNFEQERSKTVKQRKKKSKLLPAGARLGNILVIVHVYAHPSALPMPSLSKGRLPLGDPAIDTTLEIGIKSCLQSLQRSNPNLFFSPLQLREAEQDAIHIPEIAAAMASIIASSPNISTKDATQIALEGQQSSSRLQSCTAEEQLKEMIENRLRIVKSFSPCAEQKDGATVDSEKTVRVFSKMRTRSHTKAIARALPCSADTCPTPESYLYIDMNDPEPCQGLIEERGVDTTFYPVNDGSTTRSSSEKSGLGRQYTGESSSDEWW